MKVVVVVVYTRSGLCTVDLDRYREARSGVEQSPNGEESHARLTPGKPETLQKGTSSALSSVFIFLDCVVRMYSAYVFAILDSRDSESAGHAYQVAGRRQPSLALARLATECGYG